MTKKYTFRIHECSRCGCKTDEGEFWMDAGWCSYGRYGPQEKDDLRNIIEGLPEAGFLCPHHSEALNAFDDGEWDLFKALASL